MPGVERVHPFSEMPSVKGAPTFKGTPSVVGMREWLQLLGHSVLDLCSCQRSIHTDKLGRTATLTT